MMEEGERKEKVGLQRRKQSGRGTLQSHFSVGLRAKHSREGISISWGPTVCRALCSFSSCRDDFYTLPEAAIVSFFFLALGAGLVRVQMPSSLLLGCVTLGSSPYLSEPPFLTHSRSTGGSQEIWWADVSLCIAPWEGSASLTMPHPQFLFQTVGP